MSCVWNVKVEDRLCWYCTRSARCASALQNGILPPKQYVEVMNKLVGENITKKTRHWRLAHPRFMVMYKMYLDGFTQKCIAGAVGLGRCTVVHGCSAVRTFLDVPNSYVWEVELWNRYEETINALKDENIRKATKMVAV